MLKKSMDILDVYSWFKANQQSLLDCFIDNAYRSKYYWLLKLRCRETSRFLKIEPGVRIHFSISESGTKEIDNFARYLRAHVRDGRFTEITLPWWERILVFKTTTRDRILRHYLELVPRGLWVLTNPEDKVLYSTRFEEFKDRVIKPGVQYTPPPVKGISPWNTDDLKTAIAKGKDLVRGIVYEWGLPGYIAEEILYRSGLYNAKNRKPAEIPLSDLDRLTATYQELVKDAEIGHGYIVRDNEHIEIYTAYKPKLFIEHHEKQVVEFDHIDEAIDRYFTELEARLEEEEKHRKLEEEAESWRKRIEEQQRKITEYEQELSLLEKTLGLIYSNYDVINNVLECSRRMVKSRDWSSVEECGVDKYDPRRGAVFIAVDNDLVELSIRESLDSQVVALEAKRGELRKKIERAKRVLEELRNNLGSIEKELSARIHAKPAPMYWYEKYRWSITHSGFIVVAGKDASQNETLVRKYLRDNDIFMHADIHGAPATIVIVDNGSPGRIDIEDAATIAACYSKAWRAGFSYVDVYWVRGSQVSKTPPPGMYIGKGSFMVYGERNYLRARLQLGIGLRLVCDEVYGDYIKVFVGSPDLVKETCISYVVITPGDLDVDQASRVIRDILVNEAYKKTNTRYIVSEETVRNVLPGSLRITESGAGRGKSECTD